MKPKKVPINMKESFFILILALIKILILSCLFAWVVYSIKEYIWPVVNTLFIVNDMSDMVGCTLAVFMSAIHLYLLWIAVYHIVVQFKVIEFLIAGKIIKYVGGAEDEETEEDDL